MATMARMVFLTLLYLTGRGFAEVQKLGLYEYFVDESSPVIYNNAFLMFESIVKSSPEWAGNWDPAFANCACYYRIRDIVKGVVIVNITETCNHAFGAALITIDPTQGNLNTFWIFGTPWIRVNSPAPPRITHSDAVKLLEARDTWSGPCASGNCSVNVFWSSDPQLKGWKTGPGAPLKQGLVVYNNDVTYVDASPAEQVQLGLPPHKWVMAIETGAEYSNFLVSNGSSAYDPSTGWIALDPSVYVVPKFGHDIGSCPSIRYVGGYYYILTGGHTIYILRSKNLKDWTLAQSSVLEPSAEDCVIAPPYFGKYVPSATAQKLIDGCTSQGFGDDSDVDLIEWFDPLTQQQTVLLQYGSGNQATFGFSNLALYNGTLAQFLQSYF